MRTSILICWVLATGCAHLDPVAPSQRDALFTCSNVTMEQAEVNLAEHGFIPKAAGKATLTTEVTEVQIPHAEAIVFVPREHGEALVDLHRAIRAQVLVYPSQANVRFRAFWGHRADVMGHRGKTLYPVSERLYFQQIDDEPTWGMLSRMREAVCGTAAPIARPEP